MFKKKNFLVIILLGIFALALFLRFFRLSDFPVGFHQDEASLGYNGYSLLLTGKDENNNPLSLYIDMFGDNRPSGYHYLTILPIKIFGLAEFATRFPGALFGSLSIFAIYFLVLCIFQNKKLGILAAFLLAISPWHIVLSRASAEAIVALFFIMVGFAFLIRCVYLYKKMYLFFGSLCLIASFFFYHTPRVFVPTFFMVLLLILFFITKQVRIRNKMSFVFSFLVVSTTAVLLIFFVAGGQGRYNQVNIFGFPETKLILDEQIREDGIIKSNLLETRIFHNKIISYGFTFARNYFQYFSGDFLFIKGGLPSWYIVPHMGLLYLIGLPFLVMGFISLSSGRKLLHKIPLLWLFFAPITAAITVDDIPNINRSLVMLPALELLTAYGFYVFIEKISPHWKKQLSLVVFVCLLWNLFYFLHQYFVNATVHKNWYRNEGVGEMVNAVRNVYNQENKIIITKATGGIYPLVLFYMQYDPRVYQTEGSPKDREYGGFGKFMFVPQACPSAQKHESYLKTDKILYVDKGDCQGTMINEKNIYRKDGTKAFRLVYE